jgi:adenylate cyclase
VTLEVERKFALSEVPDWLADHRRIEIAQGYLAITDEVEVRIRRAAEGHFLAVKSGHGEVREEIDVDISEEQFDELWPLTERLRLVKDRYLVPIGDLTAEVDVYGGALEGLAVAEVEFPSAEESRGFEPPDWLGEEVTGDDRYANQNLARSGPPNPAGRNRRDS